jgi:hypothetical protein
MSSYHIKTKVLVHYTNKFGNRLHYNDPLQTYSRRHDRVAARGFQRYCHGILQEITALAKPSALSARRVSRSQAVLG